MRPPKSRIWIRRGAIALSVGLALAWVPFQLFGRSGLAHLMDLRRQIAIARGRNGELRRQNALLRAEISLFDDDDPAAIERIARDELGLVRPGEIVFRIEGPR